MTRLRRVRRSRGENPASARISALCSPTRGGWRTRPGRWRSAPNSIGRAGSRALLAVLAAVARQDHLDQPAGRQQVRVVEQIARLADRRPRHLRALAPACDLVARDLPDHLLQRGDQPGPLREPHDVGREPRIGGQLLQAELLDKARPLLVAGDADKELAVARGVEDLVDRPGAAPDRHRPRVEPGRRHPGHMRAHQKRGVLEQRARDALALSGRIALAQRRLHRDDAEHRAHDVDDRGAGAQRPARRPGHEGKAGLELHDLVQAPGGARKGRRDSPSAPDRPGAG